MNQFLGSNCPRLSELVFGVSREAELIESQQKIIRDVEITLRKRFNLSIAFEYLNKDELTNIKLDEELPKGIHVLLFSMMTSLLETRIKENVRGFTDTYIYSPVLMITGTPEQSDVTSSELFQSDKYVTCFFGLSLLLVSLLVTGFQIKTEKGRFKNFGVIRGFFISLWDMFFLLFFEPLHPRKLVKSVIMVTWLIAVTVINSQLSPVMNSKFSATRYETVDTIEDLQTPGSHFVLRYLENALEERTIKTRAKTQKDFKYVLENTEKKFITEDDVIDEDFYNSLTKNEVVIMDEYILDILFGFVFGNMDNYTHMQKLRISQPLFEEYQALPLSFNLSSCSFAFRAINDFVNAAFETKVFKPYNNLDKFAISKIQWSIPPAKENPISFREISGITWIIYVGNGLAIATLLLEALLVTLKVTFRDLNDKDKVHRRHRRRNWRRVYSQRVQFRSLNG